MPLPGFTRELATMRSRNISASTIIQNMAQIKELFKDSWETIPGNSDTILYLGGNESSTHKYISEALGKATIDTRTHGQTKGKSVEGLERLGVEQAHQKIERLIVVRYDGVQRALPLPQGVEIHIIPVPFWTKAETALLQAIILMLWQEAPEYEQRGEAQAAEPCSSPSRVRPC